MQKGIPEMTATTVDLRYRTHDILKSLERRESILITLRGKPIGTIVPYSPPGGESAPADMRKHPFFGCDAQAQTSVEEEMAMLRGGRFDAL